MIRSNWPRRKTPPGYALDRARYNEWVRNPFQAPKTVSPGEPNRPAPAATP